MLFFKQKPITFRKSIQQSLLNKVPLKFKALDPQHQNKEYLVLEYKPVKDTWIRGRMEELGYYNEDVLQEYADYVYFQSKNK